MTKMLHVYRLRRFQRTWSGVNRLTGCGIPVSARCQEPLSHLWACPLCPHKMMTMMLHIYRPRWFQWTWLGLNRHNDYWVSASARFQEPLSCPWAPTLCPHWQMTMMLHIYRSRRFQWPWFGMNQPSGCGVLVSARFHEPLSCPWLCPHRQVTMALHIYRPRRFQ